MFLFCALIIQAHCSQTINDINTRVFVLCCGKPAFLLVPKIHRCYKKYVSNELFSKTGGFCSCSVLCEKLRSLLCHEDKSA